MDRLGRNDKILTSSGIKEKENRFGKTSPRLGASLPESIRERTFEKRVVQKYILRDTGATIDLVCAKHINPTAFSGENVWVKQLLSPELVCLPLAVVEISGDFGTVQTKAAVCGNHLNQHGRYLLGNKTAELIKENLGYNFLPMEQINAVQTRSQVKATREERGIDSGDDKKGEDEAIIVSSDAEDEILIPTLRNILRN
ncbi:retrovirus-related Pol polyprotein from transposon 412 [Trichonephila inaurata madagascariensis]|uniref:Retrovirus-related Pol polyprotein from transposon 412 n=1 Tax=Trichonephila inaurata madagascariensis TaxID=2747483 RepID=A0A8X6XRB7_9ARAC|nr:retrovirus-related Pol polyprotein from transposon 412 [Trichonephila inaurata madagascariensis]